MYELPPSFGAVVRDVNRSLIITTVQADGKKRSRTFNKFNELNTTQMYMFQMIIMSLLDAQEDMEPETFEVRRRRLVEI